MGPRLRGDDRGGAFAGMTGGRRGDDKMAFV